MCNKFEESGLLYVAGELSESEAREYEAHVAVCEECRRETEAYRAERAELYTVANLEERPSPTVDAEILRIGSSVRKAPTAFAPMLFLKKYAAIPISLMLIMVAVGGYFNYHAKRSFALRAELGGIEMDAKVASVFNDTIKAAIAADEELAMSDSEANLRDTFTQYPQTRGNLELEGVVTVKGTGER